MAQKSPHPPFPSCWSPHGRKWQRSAKTSSWISSSSVPTESSCPSRLCDEEVGLPKNDRLPKKRRVAIPPLHPPNPTFSPASPLPPLVFPQGCVGPNFFFEHRPMTRTGGGWGFWPALVCASDEYLVLAHRQWSQAPPKVKTASPVAFGPFPTPALTAAMRYGELSAHQTRPEPSAGFGFQVGKAGETLQFFWAPSPFPV